MHLEEVCKARGCCGRAGRRARSRSWSAIILSVSAAMRARRSEEKVSLKSLFQGWRPLIGSDGCRHVDFGGELHIDFRGRGLG